MGAKFSISNCRLSIAQRAQLYGIVFQKPRPQTPIDLVTADEALVFHVAGAMLHDWQLSELAILTVISTFRQELAAIARHLSKDLETREQASPVYQLAMLDTRYVAITNESRMLDLQTLDRPTEIHRQLVLSTSINLTALFYSCVVHSPTIPIY